jgi:hypothetical protein
VKLKDFLLVRRQLKVIIESHSLKAIYSTACLKLKSPQRNRYISRINRSISIIFFDLKVHVKNILKFQYQRQSRLCKVQCATKVHLSKKYGEKKWDFSCQIAVLQYFLDFSSVSDVF